MNPLLHQSNGIWIGWTGETTGGNKDEKRTALIDGWAKQHRYFAVDLDPEIARGYYEGIANEVLWPLLHHFPSLMRFDPADWNAYQTANEIFCAEILKHLRPDDLVWIHDYHFLLLPQMLREAVPDASIGFFLHVPFPSSSVFRILPRREQLLRGMLGADYLGFHTHSYLQNFRTSVLRLLGISSQMDRIDIGTRSVRLDALPIGIAADDFNNLLIKNQTTRTQLTELKRRFGYRKIILAVDRLDYTKGIPERLKAYRRFLQAFPEWRDKVVLIQIAAPSRERIAKYNKLKREVDQLIGEINGDWSTPNWSPITYVRRSLPQAEIAALYAAADVALVTPLRDGLNLVAKEYVACKSTGDGVLVLSEFAGASAEMGEALLVNPYDEEEMSDTIERALTLGDQERRDRMLALYRRVHKNNVFSWGKRFIENLTTAVNLRCERAVGEPFPLPAADLLQSFSEAKSRLLMLDYDGTLAPYTVIPGQAAPSTELLGVLKRLAGLDRTLTAVVSGRSRTDLERWFGSLKNIWLVAEHGAIWRSPGSPTWEQSHHTTSEPWKSRVFPVFDHFVDRTPGSFIEEKEFSLVWHYRMADAEFGEWLANELVANLNNMLADSPVRAVKGQKTVEAKLFWADKGQVFSRLLSHLPEPELILAAGDDVTDEDLFAKLPPEAWTIHVGPPPSRARYYVPGPDEFLEVLHQLTANVSEQSVDSPETKFQTVSADLIINVA